MEQYIEEGLPEVVAWVEAQERMILEQGEPLCDQGLQDAKAMGVEHPERIRLLEVDDVPLPDHPLMREAAVAGLLVARPSAMCVRYGLFIRRNCPNKRYVIAHECVHTSQFERLGGIEAFSRQYLIECFTQGYMDSPLEAEAMRKTEGLMQE